MLFNFSAQITRSLPSSDRLSGPQLLPLTRNLTPPNNNNVTPDFFVLLFGHPKAEAGYLLFGHNCQTQKLTSKVLFSAGKALLWSFGAVDTLFDSVCRLNFVDFCDFEATQLLFSLVFFSSLE